MKQIRYLVLSTRRAVLHGQSQCRLVGGLGRESSGEIQSKVRNRKVTVQSLRKNLTLMTIGSKKIHHTYTHTHRNICFVSTGDPFLFCDFKKNSLNDSFSSIECKYTHSHTHTLD